MRGFGSCPFQQPRCTRPRNLKRLCLAKVKILNLNSHQQISNFCGANKVCSILISLAELFDLRLCFEWRKFIVKFLIFLAVYLCSRESWEGESMLEIIMPLPEHELNIRRVSILRGNAAKWIWKFLLSACALSYDLWNWCLRVQCWMLLVLIWYDYSYEWYFETMTISKNFLILVGERDRRMRT